MDRAAAEIRANACPTHLREPIGLAVSGVSYWNPLCGVGRAMSLKMRILPRCLYVKRLRPSCDSQILLTFDDGPHPETTVRVLGLLREYEARAIFFVIGSRIHRAPELLSRIVDEGHLLGNHTFTHPLDRRFGFRDYKADLLRCEDVIREHASVPLRYHRPPLGIVSMATAFAPRSLGLRTILWSVEARDWSLQSNDEALRRSQQIATMARPRDIICFHDEEPSSAALLQDLLPRLRDRGFRFDVPIEEAL
jgi:peptidoglycan/xylan/chitin deacetylase (PgdA/CDA1 family)